MNIARWGAKATGRGKDVIFKARRRQETTLWVQLQLRCHRTGGLFVPREVCAAGDEKERLSEAASEERGQDWDLTTLQSSGAGRGGGPGWADMLTPGLMFLWRILELEQTKLFDFILNYFLIFFTFSILGVFFLTLRAWVTKNIQKLNMSSRSFTTEEILPEKRRRRRVELYFSLLHLLCLVLKLPAYGSQQLSTAWRCMRDQQESNATARNK